MGCCTSVFSVQCTLQSSCWSTCCRSRVYRETLHTESVFQVHPCQVIKNQASVDHHPLRGSRGSRRVWVPLRCWGIKVLKRHHHTEAYCSINIEQPPQIMNFVWYTPQVSPASAGYLFALRVSGILLSLNGRGVIAVFVRKVVITGIASKMFILLIVHRIKAEIQYAIGQNK